MVLWTQGSSCHEDTPLIRPFATLRGTFSRWEKDRGMASFGPSPTGRGWREAPGEGRAIAHEIIQEPAPQLRVHQWLDSDGRAAARRDRRAADRALRPRRAR